ncbi:MAG: methyltransferase domain-containing protein [Bacteroidetes bacterium]|nr:methyltransferase domain-containing protein [Bacteroidota bacterium]MCW5895854.1 methyltransferase domain-containing protein [Bacteroidota bacterium]
MKSSLIELVLSAYHALIPPKIDREIKRALSLSQQNFPQSVSLPRNYGRGMTERVVELLVAQLTYRAGKRVLDVGHANIMNAHARMLKSLPSPVDITGVDIVPAGDEVRLLYTNSVVANIAKTDFQDESFDLIWCISALEHFGMDNSIYTSDFTLDKEMDKAALKEMMRIIRVGGMIYISVPFGKFEDHGWLRNYDSLHWQELLAVARNSSHINELYFTYSDESGWRPANPDELYNTGYSDHQNAGASGLAVALIQKER